MTIRLALPRPPEALLRTNPLPEDEKGRRSDSKATHEETLPCRRLYVALRASARNSRGDHPLQCSWSRKLLPQSPIDTANRCATGAKTGSDDRMHERSRLFRQSNAPVPPRLVVIPTTTREGSVMATASIPAADVRRFDGPFLSMAPFFNVSSQGL